ncbi:transcriptional regulator with XRE-family HTH domain [Paenibacillus mucilaginosus]|uniref:helix-turn-helix domain-containing protein n=1 Tax=Paenibacillus mucilaginosus TaxID=61624 RepID=UPI003D2191AD
MGTASKMSLSEFGRHLEVLRGSMSLREAARKSGLSHAYIRDLELSRNRSTNTPIVPSPETLKRLANAYGYSYIDLMIESGLISESEHLEQHYGGGSEEEEIFLQKFRRMSNEKKKRLLKLMDNLEKIEKRQDLTSDSRVYSLIQ